MLVSWAAIELAPLMFIVPLSVIVTPSLIWTLAPAPTSERRAPLHREAGREDVELVDRRGRADRDQGHRLPAVEAAAVEVDGVEALVGGQERHVDDRGGDGGGEDVVGEVAAVEHAAVDQGEVDPVEGAAGGGEVAAGVDLDVGGDAGCRSG